jgi:DNA polymerase-3 subunit delta'
MEGVGKSLFARELAGCLLTGCAAFEQHPDFHVLRPEGKSGLHAIDELRKCIDQVYEAPFASERKVFVIHDAERMQAPSANALLKTLEEPPLDTTIILLTSQAREILPTILSRCIQLHFQPLSTECIVEILTARGLSAHFASLAHGSASKALLLATDSSFLEMQKILLSLLSKPVFYPDLADELDKVELLLEPIKEENPVAYHRRVDMLFATLLMWARDQILLSVGGGSAFFPDEAKAVSLPSLSAFERTVQEARTAFQRNMKLSVCLQQCFLI